MADDLSTPADRTPGDEPGRPGRRRVGRTVAVAAGAAVLLGAVVVGAQALSSSDEPAEAETSTPAPERTTPSPEPSEASEPSDEPTDDTTTQPASALAGQPTAAWTVSGTSYGPAGTEVWLADEQPLGVPNVSEVAVVRVYAEAGPLVLGLDRTTGDELWRYEPGPGTEAWTTVLDDGSTVAHWQGTGDGDFTLTTLDTASGEVQGTVDLSAEPAYAFSDETGTVVVSVVDGAMAFQAFDAGLTEVWSSSTEPGLVPATEFYGEVTADSGQIAVFVSGASAVVDRASGEVLTTSGDSALLLLPGGLLRDISSVGGDATITDGVAGQVVTDGAGGAWDVIGPVQGLPTVVGVGGRAADPETGESPWSLEGDPAGLTATVVGDLVVPFDRTAQTPVVAVDARTGEQRWVSKALNGELGLHDGTLVVETEATVVGVDLTDGDVLWTVDHTPATSPTSFDRSSYQVIGGSLVTSTVAGDLTAYTFAP